MANRKGEESSIYDFSSASMFEDALETTDRSKRIADNPEPEFTINAASDAGKDKVCINAAGSRLVGLGNRQNLEILSDRGRILKALSNAEGKAALADHCASIGKDLEDWLKNKTPKNNPISFFIYVGKPLTDDVTGKPIMTINKRLFKKELAVLMEANGVTSPKDLPDSVFPLIQACEGFRMTCGGIKEGEVGYDMAGNDSKNWRDLGGNHSEHIIYAIGEGMAHPKHGLVYPLSYKRNEGKIEKTKKEVVEE